MNTPTILKEKANSFWDQKLYNFSKKLLKCRAIKLFVILENRLRVFKIREGEFYFCLREFF